MVPYDEDICKHGEMAFFINDDIFNCIVSTCSHDNKPVFTVDDKDYTCEKEREVKTVGEKRFHCPSDFERFCGNLLCPNNCSEFGFCA